MSVPPLWLMTDERVQQADLMRAIARLPRGSAVVVRHYRLDEAARHVLFQQVRSAARRRGCIVLLAGAPGQALQWGADGHHGGARGPQGKRWLHSAAAHDLAELRAAQKGGADVVLVSPLFSTRSHPGTLPLGCARFAAIVRRSQLPVIALGGVKLRHALLVRQIGAHGLAAIDGLTLPRRSRDTGPSIPTPIEAPRRPLRKE